MMTLVQAIKETGLSETAIRHYEAKGLIKAPRSDRGAILVTKRVVDNLRTIAAARNLGFSVEDCGNILSVLQSSEPELSGCQVQLTMIQQKRHDLERLESQFQRLVQRSEGLQAI